MALSLLIDTQVLVWSLLDRDRLSAAARQSLDQADDISISAASLYEIEYKRRAQHRRGVATLLERLPEDLPKILARRRLPVLDVTAAVAWAAARLPIEHGDPWDRIILAQAADAALTLVSSDAILRAHSGDIAVVW